MKRILSSVCVALILAGCTHQPSASIVSKAKYDLPSTRPLQTYSARAKGGMVASVHPLATDAGVEAMRRGGNAIDAAVATALTLGVVDGHNSGIGGGCFMLIRFKDGSFMALDGREMAGAKATRDMFIRDGKGDTKLSQTGPLASGVPGSIAVFDAALKAGGKRTLADALLPAADLAERGFPLDEKYANKLKANAKKIAQFPGSAAILLKSDGSPYTEGEVLRQTDLANTYRAIAAHGSAYFYQGEFAKKVSDWMAANGGILTREDFAGYKLVRREPIVSTYRGYTLIGFPPPSSGGVHVAQILNILENFNVGQLSTVDREHVTAEAMKQAFADRAWYLGDPDYVRVPKGLMDKGYAKQLASKITLASPTTVPSHGVPPKVDEELFGKHTTHIATADAEGNWVALTCTVNTAFGSKVIVPGTGVILNNQMDDFSIQPGVPNAFKLVGNENNAIAPGKRPLSSMSPTIVLNAAGKPIMTVGAAGGPKIITQVVLAIRNVVDLHDDLPHALARERVHHQWSPDEISAEEAYPTDMKMALEAKGHKLEVKKNDTPISGGATQAIIYQDGYFIGVSEPRVPGKAAGVP